MLDFILKILINYLKNILRKLLSNFNFSKNPNKMNIEIIEGQTRNPNNMRNFSMPRHQSLETLQFNGNF